jgi:hypothetical protein
MPEDAAAAAAATPTEAEINAKVTPADAREVIEPSKSAPKAERPSITELFEAEKAAGTMGDNPDEPDAEAAAAAAAAAAAKPAAVVPEAAKPADKPEATPENLKKLEGKTEEELATLAAANVEDLEKLAALEAETADAVKAKADLDSLLETFDDPAVLNAALARAGVAKVAELPAVKELVGRMVQSARDQTRNELMKAQAQAAQLADVTKEGRAAKDKLVAALDKLATDIDEGDAHEGPLNIPTADAIKQAFDEYAGAAVGEYHTKAWQVLSDSMYSLPEMGGPVPDGVKTQPPAFSPEQKQLLAAVAGTPDSALWMAAHLAVERDVLWTWAQAEAAANNQTSFEGEKTLLQAAHAKEIKELTKNHAAEVKTARDEARAEALADAATPGKLPPKTPKTPTARITATDPDDDGIPQGATIKEIRGIIAARQNAGVEV